jgi:hypothetical protein
MTRFDTNELQNQIEALVDANSLEQVLEGVSAVAFLKAEHISTHRQDRTLAAAWEASAKLLDKAAYAARGI